MGVGVNIMGIDVDVGWFLVCCLVILLCSKVCKKGLGFVCFMCECFVGFIWFIGNWRFFWNFRFIWFKFIGFELCKSWHFTSSIGILIWIRRLWFQLYVLRDQAFNFSLLDRARDAGYGNG